MDIVKFTIFLVVILWIGWFLIGGPQNQRTGLPFLKPPSPLDSGEIYGPSGSSQFVPSGALGGNDISSGAEQSEDKKVVSIFEGSFALQSGNVYAEKPEEEYLVIYAAYNNTQPVSITGWKLKSGVSGTEAIIGKGAYLPFSGAVNKEEQIFLNPGDRATITTGRSPNGISFRLNTCTGYFEQFQDFIPSLAQECPYQRDEKLPIGPGQLNDACVRYIESLPQCFAHIAAIPIGLSPECSEYINKNIHYNGCMQAHKNDPNFYKPEWRIFLGRDTELWKQSRETIKLLDPQGKIIDSLSY